MNATRPAFDAALFEKHVQEASRPSPPIRAELQSFIHRHAPGTQFKIGARDGYDWSTKEIILTKETAKGQGMRAYLTVAHEVAHAQQHLEYPWVPSWAFKFPIIRAIAELDAWQRSLRFLS